MKRLLGLLLALVFLPSSVTGQPKLPPEAMRVSADNNDFALDLYHQLAKKDGNLFFSPYSISTALAMTYAGARGNTAEEMKTTIHLLQERKTLNTGFQELQEHLLGKDPKRKFALSLANRLFGQKGYGFLPEFVKTTSDYYGAGLEEVDFVGATEAARRHINKWVEDQTHDKIKELLKKGILSADSVLVLVNAIYFKAAWAHPFDAKNTADAPFFIGPEKSVKAPMMRQSWATGYGEAEGVSVVELPYEGRQLSMFVLLPARDSSLDKLEGKLTRANLDAWLGKMTRRQVDLQLPRFKLTSEFLLNKTLSDMGMKDAFISGRADFSGLTTREKLFITHVIHKAFIDVNEAGTEAAAATAVVIGRSGPPRPATFHADRPFVYFLRDNASGQILFIGRVTNPT
ncbi:MAG: serpin family protein [Gemmataceae bacterium]